MSAALVVAALALEPDPPLRLAPPVVHALLLFSTQRALEAYMWPEPFADTRSWGAHYRAAFTQPPLFDPSRRAFEWDGDAWWLNVIGHGAMGSELHLRARLCGFGLVGSIAWTTGASAVWEYVFEANGVRPSAQDLVWTPLAGFLLGEARFAIFRGANGIGDGALRRFVQSIADPFGEIEHALTANACARLDDRIETKSPQGVTSK